MKKRLIALVLMLCMVLTFGLVACGETAEPTDTTGIETELTSIEAVIAELKTQLAANKLDLAALQTALNGINTNSASLEQLEELANIVAALQGTSTAEIYESFVKDATFGTDGSFSFFGGVHNLYLGQCTVVINSGEIENVYFDEFFVPGIYASEKDHWGVTDMAASDFVETADANGNPVFYAKFIQVGTAVFQIQTDASGKVLMTTGSSFKSLVTNRTTTCPVYKQLDATPTASPETYPVGAIGEENGDSRLITDLAQSIFSHQDTAAWYAKSILNGDFKIMRVDNTGGTSYFAPVGVKVGTGGALVFNDNRTEYKLSVAKGTTEGGTEKDTPITTDEAEFFAGHGINKRDGVYWQPAVDAGHLTGNRLGWGVNAKYLEEAFKAYYFFDVSRFSKPAIINQWCVGPIVTGATLTDFKDYWYLAQCAIVRAIGGIVDGANVESIADWGTYA